MANCPECGGNVIGKMKKKICETCGLALTPTEFDRAWRKIRETKKYGIDEDPNKKRKREYLDWYESSKD